MQLVSVIFNTMVTIEHIPDCFKRGIIIQIPKTGNKDQSVKDNLTLIITFLSVLYKLFEKMVLHVARIVPWFKKDEKISKLQEHSWGSENHVNQMARLTDLELDVKEPQWT